MRHTILRSYNDVHIYQKCFQCWVLVAELFLMVCALPFPSPARAPRRAFGRLSAAMRSTEKVRGAGSSSRLGGTAGHDGDRKLILTVFCKDVPSYNVLHPHNDVHLLVDQIQRYFNDAHSANDAHI